MVYFGAKLTRINLFQILSMLGVAQTPKF